MKRSACCLAPAPEARAFLKSALRGFALRFFPTAAAFLSRPPSAGLVIVDSSLPDMAAGDLAAVLRSNRATAGLTLVLTGPGPSSPAAAAALFDRGADEYFVFPPEPLLFRARVLNLLARQPRGAAARKPEEYAFGPLRVSPEARTVSVDGRRARLTALEFDLLLYFLRNPGRVVSRYVLLEQVWKLGAESGTRAVDKRIEALRRKLGRFGASIRTVFGLGYLYKG